MNLDQRLTHGNGVPGKQAQWYLHHSNRAKLCTVVGLGKASAERQYTIHLARNLQCPQKRHATPLCWELEKISPC